MRISRYDKYQCFIIHTIESYLSDLTSTGGRSIGRVKEIGE